MTDPTSGHRTGDASGIAPPLRIVFMGAVRLSEAALSCLVHLPFVRVVGVVTLSKGFFNADFCDLGQTAHNHGIPVFYQPKDGIQDVVAQWVRGLAPDVIYCFGWSRLLRADLLTAAPLGVVGFHPAALPANRGRHPLIWALALGLNRTASTFFFMDEQADSGPIISQEEVPIREDDYAADLYLRVIQIALGQIPRFSEELWKGSLIARHQNHTQANYWRKRSADDGKIDWRMSAMSVYNLVRALSRPYPGAHALYCGQEIKVWKTELVTEPQRSTASCQRVPGSNAEAPYAPNIEPGKVLRVEGGVITVKCGSGAIRLLEHGFAGLKEGSYL